MKLRRTSMAFTGPLQWGLATLASLSIIYMVLFSQGVALPYVKTSTLHKVFLLSAELFLCATLYQIYLRNAWGEAHKTAYLLVFLIANCFLTYPFLVFYLDKTRQDVPLIRAIQPYLTPAYITLLGATCTCGLLAHRDVARFRAWLVGEFEGQKAHEQLAESARLADYPAKYPKLTSMPLIGRLVGALYREGWSYILALLALVALGLALRTLNLAALPPYADEMYHLETARAIVQGQPLNEVEYRRSLYTVTIPIAISFKLFGVYLWSARFTGVIANLLAVVPLYMLGKRINKSVALLAAGLYVFNPWIIAVSRTVREYAYYPLCFYMVAWVMLKFYEGLPTGLILWRDRRNFLTPLNLTCAAVLALVLYYSAWIDRLSTFKMIYGLYLVFAIFLLRKVEWRNSGNLLIGLMLAAAGALLTITMLKLTGGNHQLITQKVNGYFITLFFDHPEQQWYYERPMIAVGVVILALMAPDYLNKKKAALPFYVSAYLVALLSLTFLYVKGNKPRYAFSIEFWHILVMAAGLLAAYLVANRLFHNKAAVWVVLLLLFWNIPHTMVPSLHTTLGYAPITGEYHANLSAAYNYLQGRGQPGDVLIVSNYFGLYARWSGGLEFDHIVSLSDKRRDAERDFFQTIEAYPHGWIVLYSGGDDLWRQPALPQDFNYKGKKVKFIGWYDDLYIFHWRD